MKNIFGRSKLNPILKPEGTSWWKVYNPGAVLDKDGIFHLFPRVMKKEKDWHSRIAHATSKDGENFKWDNNSILEREGNKEKRGLEDPRITLIGDTYHMAFAAYDGKSVQLHTAVTKDLNGKWLRNGPALPHFDFFKSGGKMVSFKNGKPVEKTAKEKSSHWSKSGAFFPQKINGKYLILFGEFYLWFATSKDGINFEAEKKTLIGPRKNTKYFDNTFVEMGPQPILTEKGWLVLYHGIDEAFRYQLGFLILDKDDPRKIIYRSEEPIFGPKESYEVGDSLIDVIGGGIEKMVGLDEEELKNLYKEAREKNIMPQVTFCTGAVVKDGKLFIYYGAGDTSVCMAYTELKNILNLVP
jgi:predicted GH43/DUF377 family glycosyl hydrolase